MAIPVPSDHASEIGVTPDERTMLPCADPVAASGWNGHQGGSAIELEAGEPAVGIQLHEPDVTDPIAVRDGPAPPTAAGTLGDRPQDRRPIGQRAATGPAQPRHREAAQAPPAPIGSVTASAQRAATASSSPARAGATRPWTRTSRSP